MSCRASENPGTTSMTQKSARSSLRSKTVPSESRPTYMTRTTSLGRGRGPWPLTRVWNLRPEAVVMTPFVDAGSDAGRRAAGGGFAAGVLDRASGRTADPAASAKARSASTAPVVAGDASMTNATTAGPSPARQDDIRTPGPRRAAGCPCFITAPTRRTAAKPATYTEPAFNAPSCLDGNRDAVRQSSR